MADENSVKRKICVVVTARPSYARCKTLLKAIQNHPKLELNLIVAASALLERYGSVVEIMKKDGFIPSAQIHSVLEGETLVSASKSTGLSIIELSSVFDSLHPDVVVSIADRYETIATAIAASYMNIPVAHVQGGEVTGSIDEKVRHAVTKLSDYHFVSNHSSYERVIKMGESKEKVFITGCPSIDLVCNILNEPKSVFNPFLSYKGVGDIFNVHDGYLVVLQHPVTTECTQASEQIEQTFLAIEKINKPTFWFWPNVDAGSDLMSHKIRKYRELKKFKHVYFFKNLSPEDFIRLMRTSKCVVGNSSAGIRECSFLGTPVVNIGTRQEGRDRSDNVIDVSYSESEIYDAILKQWNHGFYHSSNLYADGSSGDTIASLLSKIPLNIEKRITY